MESTGATSHLLMTLRRPAAVFLLLFLLVLSPTSSLASAGRSRSSSSSIPRLGVTAPRGRLGITRNRNADSAAETTSSLGLQTYYYNQTLDHFSYTPGSYATFPQRYVINFEHWRGGSSGAPIFAELGAEASLGNDVGAVGFLPENAPKFGALQVYIEHRFYGNSVPLGGSQEEALKNATVRGYFNSEQALADYAEVLLHVKKSLKARNSPIIVFGGSYGGMLATWFRLKYPHIALGALASSAPILYFDDITPSNGYYSVVTKDFKETSESCYQTIKESWAEIDRLAAHKEGLAILSKKFHSCKTLSAEDAEALKSQLDSIYCVAAQYNRAPPNFGLQKICDAIDRKAGGSSNRTDHLLDRIFAGMAAYTGIDTGCYNYTGDDGSFSAETLSGWDWQTCSELVMPIGITGVNDTMFPKEPFHMKEFAEDCKAKYGVLPRPHWITSYYGGHDIKEVLKRFGSNIIFSNGLVDPYSSAGVLEDISESLVALKTEKGSHCMDIVRSREDDPEWLVEMRLRELQIISGWIMQYYQDLLQATT